MQATGSVLECSSMLIIIQRSLEKFVDWGQCAAVMQREAVTYAKL
jgi:hypothetical protein